MSLLALALTLAQGAMSQDQTATASEPRLLRQPAIHGETIVFVHAGDLWVTSTNGGDTRRLTSHPGGESRPKISPDGKWVSFTGSYDGNPDVYVVPIVGGEPKRLTYEPQADIVLGWTPDGKVAYASNFGSSSTRTNRMWTVSPQGGMPHRAPVEEIVEGSFLDANTLVYNRFGGQSFNWRKYRGGTQGRISIFNLKTNAYRELPTGREQNYWPMVAGRTIVYASDKALGTLNLYQYNLDSGKETTLTTFSDADVRWPTTDGKKVAFERDGRLYTLDLATKSVNAIRPRLLSDFLQARPALRRLAGQVTGLAVSPTGTRVLLEARGEIFNVPARDGDTKNVTETTGSRERFPIWSPDGKSIAYAREDENDKRLYMRPANGGDESLVTSLLPPNVTGLEWSPDGKFVVVSTRGGIVSMVDIAAKTVKEIVRPPLPGTTYDISPDSKWLALTMARPNGLAALYLYEIASGKLSQVTEGYYNDTNVTFDQNGEYLYIMSERTFNQPGDSEGAIDLTVSNATRVYVLPLQANAGNPLDTDDEEEPQQPPQGARPPMMQRPPMPGGPQQADSDSVKIDLVGLGKRAIPLPLDAGTYFGIIGVEDGVIIFTPEGVIKFDLDSKSVQPILPNMPMGISFNAKRTKMAVMDAPGIVRVLDVRPGLPPMYGRVDLSNVEAMVDPRAEWKQIFWESWRWYRDNYYDAGMRGLNWKAIGDRYAKYLPYVDHRTDLNEVIGRMIAELGTGHSYVSGGDMGVTVPGVPTGLLGADYDVKDGKVIITKIYTGDAADETRRGPLSDTDGIVKEGYYLMAIDGKTVDANHSPSSLLVNKVGKYVTLTVSQSGTKGDAKTVRIMPIPDESNLRYAEWVEGNRKRVAELSGGRIGYLHVPNTGEEGANEFTRGYRGQTDKDALIVDERNNGGGNLPTYFIERLSRRNATYLQQRNGIDVPDTTTIVGPKVMLINQNAGSGGDMFPWLFRNANLGTLIGTRTWGGLVGISSSAPLVDGGQLFAPEFSIYDPKTNQIIAENTGVDPDIDVDNRPDLVAKGQDPQLERAVQVLLEELKKLPARPVRTKVPTVGDRGKVPQK